MRIIMGVGVIFLGFISVLLFRYIQARSASPFTPQQSTFILAPPTQAITATITQTTGIVEHLTREADDYQEATPGGAVRQGESIATKNGTALITLGNLGTVSLMNNAEISLVHLIPDSLMFLHKAGSIDYKTDTSIRVLHAFVQLSGDATISVRGPIVTVLVTQGTAKLALVDIENNTKVWEITQGQSVIVNDETRTIVYTR